MTDEAEWAAYVHDVRQHPGEAGLRRAKEFAREVMRDHERVVGLPRTTPKRPHEVNPGGDS